MYLELRIIGDYGNKADFIKELKNEIGSNAAAIASTLAKTSLQRYASIVLPKVVAAEQILHTTHILYFLEGRDTIVVHIAGRIVADTKVQAKRLARRLPKLFADTETKLKISAVIYAPGSADFDTPVIKGEQMSFWKRLFDTFAERWLTRIVTPAIIFSGAAAFLPNSSLFQSASIGLAAAVVSVVIEGIIFARKAEEWEWKEV